MHQRRGQPRQLRHPLKNKSSIWIMIQRLFYRVVDTDGVDARDSGLHLHLRVVDPRFKVEKQ